MRRARRGAQATPPVGMARIDGQSGVGAAGIADTAERTDRQAALVDANAHRAVAGFVQIGVRGEESLLLRRRQVGHAVHVVVAVAFDVPDAQQRHQRQVLLQRQAGLDRQVLGAHDVAAGAGVERVVQPFLAVPEPAARAVEDGLVQTLAGLRRHAGITHRAAAHEGVERVVGLVDDHGLVRRQRADMLRHRGLALDRLLDEYHAAAQLRQSRFGAHALPQRQHAAHVVVLLVAVQRGAVAAGYRVQHAGDAGQPVDVGVDVAGHLELEPALPVGGHHLVQRFGQAIVHAMGLVGARDRVDQAHGVAGIDVRRRLQAGQEAAEVEAGQVGAQLGGADAHEVVPNDGVKRLLQRAAQRIEHGAVDQRRAVIGDQRIESPRRSALDLGAVVAAEVPEGALARAAEVELARDAERRAQLVEVVFVAQRRVLVEPLGRQQLGRHALAAAAVGEPDAHARKDLRRLGQRDDAEAKRHAQPDIALEQVDAFDGQTGCGVHGRPTVIPCPAGGRCAACRRRTVPASSCPACAGAAGGSRSCRPCGPGRR